MRNKLLVEVIQGVSINRAKEILLESKDLPESERNKVFEIVSGHLSKSTNDIRRQYYDIISKEAKIEEYDDGSTVDVTVKFTTEKLRKMLKSKGYGYSEKNLKVVLSEMWSLKCIPCYERPENVFFRCLNKVSDQLEKSLEKKLFEKENELDRLEESYKNYKDDLMYDLDLFKDAVKKTNLCDADACFSEIEDDLSELNIIKENIEEVKNDIKSLKE